MDADSTGYFVVAMASGIELPPLDLRDLGSVHHSIDMDLAWVTATDIYGDPHRIRVDEIAVVGKCTPEGIARQKADRLRHG